MVFLGLVHMLTTVPNLVFPFIHPPLIPFGFCSSYQLLIRFSAHDRGGQAGAKGKGRKENPSVVKTAGKGPRKGGEGNRRKAPMSGA
jgi:hypothetical protein